jgi:hypothetical protein
MALKKLKELPLGGYIKANFIPSSITANQIEAIPPYPDVGIEFKGYAKRLISGGYQLLKQDNYQLPMGFSWVASNAWLTLSANSRENTQIYINRISFSFYSDTACTIDLMEYPSGVLIARVACGAGDTGNMNIDLTAPYKLGSTTYVIQPSTPITGTIVANVSGWYESTG